MWLLISTNILNYYQYLCSLVTWMKVFQTLAVLLLLRFIYTQFIYVYISPLRNMPSTNFTPIVGCLPEAMKSEACALGEMWFKKLNSPIFRAFWLFGQERVAIADADLAKQVFITHSKIYRKAPENYEPLKPIFGNGLVMSEGHVHRKNRKFCNNFFKINMLQKAVLIFDKLIKDLIDMWSTEISNTHHEDNKESFAEIPMEKELTNFTLDVIGKFAFDYDFQAIKHSDNKIKQIFQKLVGALELSWGILIFIFFPKLNTNFAINFKNQVKSADEIIYQVMEKKKNEAALHDSSDETNSTNLLTSLLTNKDTETGEKMDDIQIRDEVFTFMLAGHETTGITLNWCLLLAARYPEMQQKIRDEVNSVIDPSNSLTFDDVEKLKYTKCFIQETLRLYSAVPGVVREALEDHYLDKYLIPKGTIVVIDINLVHKNPKYWENPNEFNPERFSDASTIYPYSYLPFIAGSRMCIGYKFAFLEMQTALARLISKFQFELIPGATYKRVQKLTLRPNPSLVLRVKEIKK